MTEHSPQKSGQKFTLKKGVDIASVLERCGLVCMSTPRYGWWPYVKYMIQRYPDRVKNPDALGPFLPEFEAVHRAVEATKLDEAGEERLEIISFVFWGKHKGKKLLADAAANAGISERVARRYHHDFVDLVAVNFGLME